MKLSNLMRTRKFRVISLQQGDEKFINKITKALKTKRKKNK